MKKIIVLFLFIQTIATSAQRYSVVVSEIMADPVPSAGLPEYEWIELYNRGSSWVNLAGWRIGDASGQSGPMPAYELQPGSAVLVAGSTAASHLSALANCLPVTSWPSLDNNGDLIVLYDNSGEVIHALQYENAWFSNPAKKEGGWTLEMQHEAYPCLGRENWKESNVNGGGSPGAPPPNLNITSLPSLRIKSCSPNNQSLLIAWTHPPDVAAAINLTNYQLDAGINILRAEMIPPLFNETRLELSSILSEDLVYNLTVKNMTSCSQRTPQVETIQFGIPKLCNPGDAVINEILFNPFPNGFDYLEIYNRSKKILDLSTLRIASRNAAGQLQSTSIISSEQQLFFPGEYRVFTTDSSWIRRNYFNTDSRTVIQLPFFPSYPDREGTAVLLNSVFEVVDEVSYSEKWHFPLLTSTEGVSLERINPELPSGQASSWHSAASTVNYGTPGIQNSQLVGGVSAGGVLEPDKLKFEISPRRLSPNHDGIEDRLIIHYSSPDAGYMAGIRVFDARGRPVRIVAHNALLGKSGLFTWDGLDDLQRPLAKGIYIVWVEWFNLQGKRSSWKEGVLLQW